MPFTSKAQARYMSSMHPKIAKEFADKTKSIARLPDHAKGARKPVVPRLQRKSTA